MKKLLMMLAMIGLVGSAYGAFIQDSDPETIYSVPWNQWSDPVYSNGSCHYNNAGSFQVTFTGTTVRWNSLKNVDLGYADIYIDDILVEDNLDCYGPNSVETLFEKTDLADGEHTIRIATTGEKNPASTGVFLVHDNIEYFAIPEPATLGLLGLSLLLFFRRK